MEGDESAPIERLDLAFVLDESIPAEKLEKAIRQGAGTLLVGLELFDVYRGTGLPDGSRSLAYRFLYRPPTHADRRRHRRRRHPGQRRGQQTRRHPPLLIGVFVPSECYLFECSSVNGCGQGFLAGGSLAVKSGVKVERPQRSEDVRP